MTRSTSVRRRWRLISEDAPDLPLLWRAAGTSYLGDGITAAALPLLAATLSDDPTVVASVVVVSRLPWLLFALPAGALVDTWDRRRIMWACDAVRSGLMALLGLAVLTGVLTVPALMAIGFLLATAEVMFDGGSVAVVPRMVSRCPDKVRAANARLMGTRIVAVDFLGPPVGGVLFTWSRAVPFLADSLSFAVSAVLLRRMRGDYRSPGGGAGSGGLLRGLRTGFTWLWRQPVLRSITVVAGLFNVAGMAQIAVLVLFAKEELGLGAVGFSLLLAVGSVGSFVGSLVVSRIDRALGAATSLRFALLCAGGASVLMGLAGAVWVACLAEVLIGLAMMVWNVVQVSLRQSGTPDDLLGRVNGVHKLVTFGAMPFGALLGGLLASAVGLRAPYVAGGVLIMALALFAALTITRAGVAGLAGDTPTT